MFLGAFLFDAKCASKGVRIATNQRLKSISVVQVVSMSCRVALANIYIDTYRMWTGAKQHFVID